MADNKTNTHKLVGQQYTTPDLIAKVTGKAKYAEDYRAEGMLWAKLLLSPMPHARVTRIDASAALAMPGVKGILTEDDFPSVQAGAEISEGVRASTITERGLSKEPLYEGEPILAVAAVDEVTAAEAIEKIIVEYEPLPFVVDPVESLRPGGANHPNVHVLGRPGGDEIEAGDMARARIGVNLNRDRDGAWKDADLIVIGNEPSQTGASSLATDLLRAGSTPVLIASAAPRLQVPWPDWSDASEPLGVA